MTRYMFKGQPTNLGRFGFVKKGDVLHLTEQEAAGVVDDKRFEVVTTKTQIPKPQLQPVTGSKEERAAAEKANRDEQARLDTLSRENNERKTRQQEIGNMTFEELRAEAEKLNKAGATIELRPDMARGELQRAVLLSTFPDEGRGGGPKPDPADGEGEEEVK